jgi:hypothetical protein
MTIRAKHLTFILAGALLAGGCNRGTAPASGPVVGAVAPEVSIPDETGKLVSLASFRGKEAVLLAFYPKDFTGG